MLESFIVELYGQRTYDVLAVLVRFYPIWLPLIGALVFWELWIRYVRYLFFLRTEMTLVEIKLPREIMKSPAAMELALLSLHQTGQESTVIDRFWKGQVRAWFSLEIASINGEIHFYIWLRKNVRDIVESQLYSQYPNIEITEVADYTKFISYKPGKNDIFAGHYKFTKPDAFPIKTFIDYGLDKDPKEEFKHDPLTAILEFMNTIRDGEQIWLQYIVRAHKSEKRKGFFSKKTDWRKAAEDELKKIHEKIKLEGRNRPSPGELEQIYGIERSLNKFPFDVGVRFVYYAEGKDLARPIITGLRGLMRPFSSQNLNGFKPDRTTDFDYPWQDYLNIRLDRKKRKMLDSYKRRMFFYYPYSYTPLTMSSEELATLFHFPGEVASAPGLPRIPSKRAQAPSNLPI